MSSMQGDQLCLRRSTDDTEGPTYLWQENTFPGPDSDGLLFSLQTSPDSHWRVIQDVCSSGGNEAPEIINPTLLKDTVTEGGTLTGVRYRDEILDPYVRLQAGAIGNDFILIDDNARPHRAVIVEKYLEDLGLERIEWPARSPDLNPIQHLWDYLGRQVASLSPPPRSLGELEQSLLPFR
ncbi:DDE_3 domain-containing protein [Trichonephila clavipes]|nr:DDE_3 domain-containing protein [Trichonephila clavipes]